MELKPLKVSEVNNYIKKILTSDPILYNISIEGEISNFKHHYSGHMYFTLKDEKSRIKCVMFKSNNKGLNILLEDGINVIVSGYISVFERDGSYQLYVKEISAKGIGELFVEFEKLKKKLDSEGLFDAKHKKPLPFLPKKIGVVTSSTGAAIRDIITVIRRRSPLTEIILYPVLVQGQRAHVEICKGLKFFNTRNDIDIIITGRGGGSLEELWAFNEEDVARAIFTSKIPVISAVGHETDFTISDFVADLRAPTPSAAGELSVPQLEQLNYILRDILIKLVKIYKNYISKRKHKVEFVRNSRLFTEPLDVITQNKQKIDFMFKDLVIQIEKRTTEDKNKFEKLGSKLNAMSPLSVLSRGYSIPMNGNGTVIKSIDDVCLDEDLRLRLKDGSLSVKVLKIDKCKK